MLGVHAVPCGQCTPCRINRRRLWVHRMMLEMNMHGDNSFVTLTYSDENLPDGLSLEPKDPQDWLKRFRKAIAPLRVRYYLVGEYGDETRRPHYHAALFGYPGCVYGSTRNYRLQRGCCPRCDLVSETWGKGGILLGQLTSESAQYVAGYVMKKMTSADDVRLDGRYPEFARMSRRPGIGSGAVPAIADALRHFNLDLTESDVPSALRHGPKILPLGRYLRRLIRKELGRDPDTPREALIARSQEMLAVLLDEKGHFSASKLQEFKSQSAAKGQKVEGRYNVFKRRTTI